MAVGVRAERLGVRYVLDRWHRPVTPVMAAVRRNCSESWALRGLDLTVGPGQAVALIGRNGAGKSTLLRVLAGVIAPDEGRAEVTGRVAALLTTTGGMALELSGRQNSVLLCMLLGLSREAAEEALPEIKRASELDGAFDSPLSTYSSGMRVRLAYSAIRHVAPDLLLLDEVRDSLDHEFMAATEEHARALRDRGGAVVVAGHDHDALRRICDEALLLESGRIVVRGPFDEVRERYLAGDSVTPNTGANAAPS
jgi:ABC-type polysaccharide/polyol phosphate transport system ATPase subunit